MQRKTGESNLFPVKIITAFLFCHFFISPVHASNDLNNLQWIEKNLMAAFDSVGLDQYLTAAAISDMQFGSVKGELKGFLKYTFIKWYDQKIQSQDSTKANDLWIEQFGTGVVYEQYGEGFLNLGTGYIRKNILTLKGWIQDRDKKNVVPLDIQKTISQKLETDNLTILDESPYNFTHGETKELSIWSSTVEPALAISSFAFIVYLFFSVRS